MDNLVTSFLDNYNISEIINASIEDDKDLKYTWDSAAEKYRKLWDSKKSCMDDVDSITDKLLQIDPHYDQLTVTTNNGEVIKSALGLTKHVRNIEHPIEVSISTATFEMSDDDFYNVVLHEMAHVASFYVDRSLDHKETWQYFKDKLNKIGYSIIEDATDFMKNF